MKLLCLSDIHGDGAGLKQVLTETAGMDAVILAGDITHLGGYEDARTLLEPLLAVGLPVLAVGGNMDTEGARRYLADAGIDIHARGIRIGSVGFLGLGGGTPSPFHTPWELAEADARELLKAGLPFVDGADYKVLVSHAPPRGTRLDRSFAGLHVGSEAVREFVLSGAVDLCLCGHIHEASGEDTVGRTPCVNLGPFKNGRYAIVTIDGSRVNVMWRKR